MDHEGEQLAVIIGEIGEDLKETSDPFCKPCLRLRWLRLDCHAAARDARPLIGRRSDRRGSSSWNAPTCYMRPSRILKRLRIVSTIARSDLRVAKETDGCEVHVRNVYKCCQRTCLWVGSVAPISIIKQSNLPQFYTTTIRLKQHVFQTNTSSQPWKEWSACPSSGPWAHGTIRWCLRNAPER
jgi:hypothetical protein